VINNSEIKKAEDGVQEKWRLTYVPSRTRSLVIEACFSILIYETYSYTCNVLSSRWL
jgi:hypothetical protein